MTINNLRRSTVTTPTGLSPSCVSTTLRVVGSINKCLPHTGHYITADSPSLRRRTPRHRATTFADNDVAAVQIKRSRLQWPWRAAGWLIGALPARISAQWVYATIHTVETFVDAHYQQQITRLKTELPTHPIIEMLERCRADEVMHQQDAAARMEDKLSLALTLWLKTVDLGSRRRRYWLREKSDCDAIVQSRLSNRTGLFPGIVDHQT